MANSSNPSNASPIIQDHAYLYASNTNVSNFVSVKLSGYGNYHRWKIQMLCLMEVHDMCCLLKDGQKDFSKKYDSLLKGWIFGSLSDDVLGIVVDLASAKDVWMKLESYFGSTKSSQQETESNHKTSLKEPMVDATLEETEIMDKDTDSVESVAKSEDPTRTKTKETESYHKTSLKELMVDATLPDTEIIDKDASSVESVAKSEDPTRTKTKESTPTEVEEKIKRKAEKAEETKNRLREAVADQNWDDFCDLLRNSDSNEAAITENIDSDGNTALHIAVGIGLNVAIESVLRHKDYKFLSGIKNSDGSTVLHIAAIVGNTDAAKMWVKKDGRFLEDLDKNKEMPLDIAYKHMHLNTIAFLLEAVETHENNKKDMEKAREQKAKKASVVDEKGKGTAVVGGKRKEVGLNQKSKKVAEGDGKSKEAAEGDGNSKEAAEGNVNNKEAVEGDGKSKEFDADDVKKSKEELDADRKSEGAAANNKKEFALTLVKRNSEYAVLNDNVLMAIARTFPSGLDYGETLARPRLKNTSNKIIQNTIWLFKIFKYISLSVKHVWFNISHENGFTVVMLLGVWLIVSVPTWMLSWILLLIRLLLLVVYFPFFMLYFLFWKVAARVVPPISDIEKKKKEYDEAKGVLELVCNAIEALPAEKYGSFYSGPILEAACQNAYEVVAEILKRWPEAIRCKDENDYDIIQLATIHRSEKIYNLIYMIGYCKSIYLTMIDSSKNNMLHLAGRIAPSSKLKLITGAALQLQRELQWREEVKKLVSPAYVTQENIFKETPEMVFTKEHENLVKEGEKWIKTVAESCSITAALIITIVFAAAITVPGGSNQDGIPVYMKEVAFTIFAVADAISLFSSATALLVFLSIVTARFAEQDFLVRLPRRLIIGLSTLLLSTTSMMVAFGATLFLVFCHDKLWMLPPLCGLAFLPIAIFFILQFPLILDLFRSTYIF